MSQQGGAREGAGRKKGSVTKSTSTGKTNQQAAGRQQTKRRKDRCTALIGQVGPFCKNRQKDKGCNATAITMFCNLFQAEKIGAGQDDFDIVFRKCVDETARVTRKI
jgi:hypothetical protein